MKKYKLDTDRSKILWTGKNKKMTINGEVEFEKGNFFVELDGKLVGKLKIDLKSIKLASNDDINENQEKDFLNHLASEDFFNVDEYPFAEYEIKEITEKDAEHTIFGILKMKEKAFGLNTTGKIDIEKNGIVAESSFKLSDVNKAITDKITQKYDGEPIESIHLKTYVKADISKEKSLNN
ncbi:YceI family protein [Fulvivirga lutea]|uniref:YceI family protein n=1 Tax=Fulvivirga lutea TaxID=2810512 RepID=A0A974WDC4_9BACT|nr:YceI family protein [Fulvivirga lutea]QSE95893.1 YceI family protein [Fulvivirga lutea]